MKKHCGLKSLEVKRTLDVVPTSHKQGVEVTPLKKTTKKSTSLSDNNSIKLIMELGMG